MKKIAKMAWKITSDQRGKSWRNSMHITHHVDESTRQKGGILPKCTLAWWQQEKEMMMWEGEDIALRRPPAQRKISLKRSLEVQRRRYLQGNLIHRGKGLVEVVSTCHPCDITWWKWDWSSVNEFHWSPTSALFWMKWNSWSGEGFGSPTSHFSPHFGKPNRWIYHIKSHFSHFNPHFGEPNTPFTCLALAIMVV